MTDYSYDINGNRTGKTRAGKMDVLTWDVNDRLVRVDRDGAQVFTAAYDYRTRRVRKWEVEPSGLPKETVFRYDQGDSFQEIEAGITCVEFVRGSGMGGGIGSILYSDRTSSGGVVEYFHYNAVGHTVATSTVDGTVKSSNLYEAYGGIVLSTGSSENNRLANTKERDFSIGLDNHGMRYFDAECGRYVSADPAGYPNGLNNWLYVNDNPINRIDPLGLGWWERFTGALQMVGGAVESFTGMALCAAPEPVLTKVGGGLLAVHGADNMSTGWRKVWTGQDQRTLTATGIKKGLTTVGVPDKEAGLIADGADAGIGLGGTTRAVTILSRANKLQKLTAEGEAMLKSGSTASDVAPAGQAAKTSEATVTATEGVMLVDPQTIRFSQTTAGGGGRAQTLRASMSAKGWEGPPVDVVKTPEGLTTLDNTRVAVAQERGLSSIPVRVHEATESLPESMLGRPWDSAGNTAKTWGEAMTIRTQGQRPKLPPTGTPDPPRMPPPQEPKKNG